MLERRNLNQNVEKTLSYKKYTAKYAKILQSYWATEQKTQPGI